MKNGISGYLSIYNDWEILEPALAALLPYLDELVVIDGAYAWMAPYVSALGQNPERSDARVYDILASCGIPYRVIAGTWENELQKRMAGYDACAHRYACRFDADQILLFDDGALDRFCSGGGAVAEMHNPSFVTPGWCLASREAAAFPRSCTLFDRGQISASIHLNYLWLILTVDRRPEHGKRPLEIWPEPVAFSAHLYGWRTLTTSVNRTAFYALNYMREHGANIVPSLRGKPWQGFDMLFAAVPPATFAATLPSFEAALGTIKLGANDILMPSGLDATALEWRLRRLPYLYNDFLENLVAQNSRVRTEGQVFIKGAPMFFDITSRRLREALGASASIRLRLPEKTGSAVAEIHTLFTTEPQYRLEETPVRLDGREGQIMLPALPPEDATVLRQCLSVIVRGPSLKDVLICRIEE